VRSRFPLSCRLLKAHLTTVRVLDHRVPIF